VRRLDRKKIRYTLLDNAFTAIEDWATAQKLSDSGMRRVCIVSWMSFSDRYCPILQQIEESYHWSLDEAEYATDIVLECTPKARQRNNRQFSLNGENCLMKKKRNKRRQFTAAMKQRAVERMKQGESVSALAREYQIERSRLYDWRERSESGRPFSAGGRLPKSVAATAPPPGELEAAQARVVDLERKVGQQTLTIDFLQRALRQLDPSRSTHNERGATASSNTSEG
jgi:transposase-like protein